MSTTGAPRQDGNRQRWVSPLLRAAMLGALLVLLAAGLASWLSQQPMDQGDEGARPVAAALQRAAVHIKSLPLASGGVALAAQATQEGHWRFVNRAGETFTAGTPAEMRRVATVLHPEAKGAPLSIYLTEDSVFGDRAALKALPGNAELFIVSGSGSYRLLRRGEGPAERLFAEVRPSLVVELSNTRAFREATWQLQRTLDKAGVRILALEPGGPAVLSASPRTDKDSGRALIDAIDPERLAGAMSTVRGQMLLVTGRIEGDLLYFQPSGGGERTMPLRELFQAAEASDVNLMVLHAASTPRQPGGRNWLWLTVQVDGLDEALQRARVADFLNALGSPSRRLAVVAVPEATRTLLSLMPAGDFPGTGAMAPLTDFFSGIVSDISGKVITTGVRASMRSAVRQQELDRRLVPGIPSTVQLVYLGLLGIGLLGVPLSRVWWQRVWPPETPADYGRRAGYWAARAARALAYALVFLPATAVLAGPWNLFGQIREGVTAPVHFVRRFRRRDPATTSGVTEPAREERPADAEDDERQSPPLESIGNVVPRR